MIKRFGLKLGILGGGQLARILASKAQSFGLEVHILSESKQDPAAQVTAHHHLGSPKDPETLALFVKNLDLLTFESEFTPATLLKNSLQPISRLKIFPSLHCLGLLQDRLTQKQALIEAHIATAPFVELKESKDFSRALGEFSKGVVFKKRRGGYDGNGTVLIGNSKALSQWLKKEAPQPQDWIAEAYIPFKRELAFSMARNAEGEMVTLPLVQTVQKDQRCDFVFGPIQHKGHDNLIAHCAHFMDDMGYEGIMAFELFDTGRELLVNEVAPRVHNSAHYSLEALNVDQFTLHLMAGLNQIFFEVKPQIKAFAMANLIGSSPKPVEFPERIESHLHWYGKSENRPGRKMGHLTLLGNSSKSLIKKLSIERKKFKNITA